MIKKNLQGFTLIELMVSVAIIAIVSGIFLANYREGGRRSDLRMAAQKLASDIRVMQGNSMALKDFNGGDLGGGFGLYFSRDSDKYELFVDINNISNRLYDSATERYQEIYFEKGIRIADEDFSGLGSDNLSFGAPGKRYLSVIFEPPSPVVHIDARRNDGTAHANDEKNCILANIKLVDNYGNSIVLAINKFGLVDIK